MLEETGFREFEGRDGVLTTDGGEVSQEIFEPLPRFQVIQQGANRHSRAGKHRRPAKDSR